MSRWNGRVVFIDGFAGPGRYVDGEPGSPIIALRSLLEHSYFVGSPPTGRRFTFLFVESKQDRAEFLEAEIGRLDEDIGIPEWVTVDVRHGAFSDEIAFLLDALEEAGGGLAPTFSFVDPFGFKGVPMEMVARIVRYPKCECLVTFMYEAINRFLGHPNEKIAAQYDELFGTDEWRNLTEISDPSERRESIVELYRNQLVTVGGLSYVRTFEMINKGNRTEYFLYFGTNNSTGLSKMKQAMWKADPLRGQVFSDRTEGQFVLIKAGAEVGLRDSLREHFRGNRWVPIEEIEEYVLVATPYSEKIHLKRKTLGVMERADPPEIEVRGRKRNIAGQYPPGTEIKFA